MVYAVIYVTYATDDIVSAGERPENMNGRLEE